jgi:hypothetical protein
MVLQNSDSISTFGFSFGGQDLMKMKGYDDLIWAAENKMDGGAQRPRGARIGDDSAISGQQASVKSTYSETKFLMIWSYMITVKRGFCSTYHREMAGSMESGRR